MKTARIAIALGGVCGLLGVAAGAFGAHALGERLSEDLLEIYRTAVLYQLIHALALLAVGAAAGALAGRDDRATRRLRVTTWSFALGVAIFCGSLYGLALSGWRTLGAITPFGGAFFLLGWAFLVRIAVGLVPAATGAAGEGNVE